MNRRLFLSVACTLVATAVLPGCSATGDSSQFVRFRAPAYPDPELRPLLENAEVIGVLSSTNIEPVQGLDIEKVMGRLTDAITAGLEHLPDTRIVAQDEIRWHFRDSDFDSTSVLLEKNRLALVDEMDIDVLVFVSLRGFEAQMTQVSPSPYGIAPSPGMNVSIILELKLIELRSGDTWGQTRRRSNWQPAQLELFGGGDRTERQLLAALAQPLRQFLARVAPPPTTENRHFDLSGD